MFARDERDLNSLMLLGPQPMRHPEYPRPYPTTKSFPTQQPMQKQVIGPCYECGGPHFARDCPNQKQPVRPSQGLPTMATTPKIPPLERYYHDYSLKHFPKDCLLKPVDLAPPKNPTTLNLLLVIPSPTHPKARVNKYHCGL